MQIQKNTTWFDEYNTHGDSEKALKALKKSEPDFLIKYIATDGWRGYYEARIRKSKNSGWKRAGEDLAGWVTGEWNDAPEGMRGSELDQKLSEIEANEVKVIFLPTSNVFSTAYDVFIR